MANIFFHTNFLLYGTMSKLKYRCMYNMYTKLVFVLCYAYCGLIEIVMF